MSSPMEEHGAPQYDAQEYGNPYKPLEGNDVLVSWIFDPTQKSPE